MAMILDVAALFLVLTVIKVDGQSSAEEPIRKVRILAPDLFMKTPERARKDGYPLETHHVLSPDGYILGLHRIPGDESAMPILLYHSLSSRSDCWIAFSPPERSLAYQLADRGYDVWMGNARGNLYSRNHTTLKPSEPAFWKYTLHEMGVNDVSATIDYILNITGHDQLFYVGHSMGNTLIYILLTTRPEYNAKIRLIISLAPAVFIGNFTSRMASVVLNLRSYIKLFLDTTENYELIPDSAANLAFVYFLCQNGAKTQGLCEFFLSEVVGKSTGWKLSELPLMVATGSGGTSAFTLWHFLQLMNSGKFQQWDFGVKGNELKYGSPQPPEYNLTMVTAPVVIYYGESDSLVTKKDVVHFSKVLPNVVDVRSVPTQYFNHLDFVAHSKLKELLLDEVVNTVDKYSSIQDNVPQVIEN